MTDNNNHTKNLEPISCSNQTRKSGRIILSKWI